MSLLFMLGGLVLLVAGAEGLVRGASRLAAAAGVTPLVIGLTVVAYGTSAPEMVVSVMSGLSGQGDIAVGNVVGSNIFNVLFILGLSALISPLIVSRQLVRFDVPLMVLISVVALVMALDGKIGRADGIALLAGAIAYTGFQVVQGRKETRAGKEKEKEGGYERTEREGFFRLWVMNGLFVAGGLALLVLGSRWLVTGAVSLAQGFGVSELVIGLTIVAAGTSLPEVATSVIASIRGERDIAVGNVIGSNIFNILAVLGLAGMITPGGISISDSVLAFDLPVMIAVAFACLPIFFTGHVIARWEGAVFLGYYAAYTTYLVLATAQHEALAAFNRTMIWFILPLTLLTLVLVSIRSFREEGRRKGAV